MHFENKKGFFWYEIKIKMFKMFVWWIFQQHLEVSELKDGNEVYDVNHFRKFDSLIYKIFELVFCFKNDKWCDDDVSNIGSCKDHCH